MSESGNRLLHVVTGEVGEYSDRREWLVCAYEDATKAAEEAKRLNDAANNAADRLQASKALAWNRWDEDEIADADEEAEATYRARLTEIDPQARDYCGEPPQYTVQTVPLLGGGIV